MTGACHCGRVTVEVPGRPEHLNVCNCTQCWQRGGLWAYYPRSQVSVAGETRGYVRADLDEQHLSTDFCPVCGITTCWTPLHADAPDRMGVNTRLFDPAELRGIEVRYGNMRDEAEGAPRYCRAPTVFDGVSVAP